MFWKVLHPYEVHTAIKNLSLKMLINTRGSDMRLDMHALVQQVGIRIQEELGNNCRVWLPMGSHRDLNIDKAEGVNMLVYRGGSGRQPFRLQSMPELQYLSMYNAVVADNIRDQAPNLIWIKFTNCEFLSDSNIWRIVRQRFQHDSWSELRIFSLKQCASIKTIPNTVDSLVNLQRLCLSDCASLTTLPANGLGNCLVNLQHLSLIDCPALATLPNALGNLSGLEELDLRRCASLTDLPDTVGNLERLICLSLGGCTCLKSLPRTISKLGKLQYLNLGRCTGLSVLPNTMGDMAQLQVLLLFGCSRLQSLPYTLGKLTQLRFLHLQGCPGLGGFEDAVVKIASLRKLNRCTGLSCLKQKDINVYLGFPADVETDPADRLYESLPTRSLSICRGWDDDVRGEAISNSDIIVPMLDENDDVSGTWENTFSAMCASGGLIIPFAYNIETPNFETPGYPCGAYVEYNEILLKSIPGWQHSNWRRNEVEKIKVQ